MEQENQRKQHKFILFAGKGLFFISLDAQSRNVTFTVDKTKVQQWRQTLLSLSLISLQKYSTNKRTTKFKKQTNSKIMKSKDTLVNV